VVFGFVEIEAFHASTAQSMPARGSTCIVPVIRHAPLPRHRLFRARAECSTCNRRGKRSIFASGLHRHPEGLRRFSGPQLCAQPDRRGHVTFKPIHLGPRPVSTALGCSEFVLSVWFSESLPVGSSMHPQLAQLRRAVSPIFDPSLRARLVHDSGGFSRSPAGFRQASVNRAVDHVAPFGIALCVQLAARGSRVYSAFRSYSCTLMTRGASPHPNYVLNRTVGDMLRSNQLISALGRLARRWAV
jgi:hypothetical protein